MHHHGLLNEKWRPQKLEHFVGNEHIKKTISRYLEQNDIQNFIFYAPPGTGKTTLAKLIVKNLDCDYIMINASDERGIETIRDKVLGFASTVSFKPLKVIILDEADYITTIGQTALRNIIETFSSNTRFILTCNYIERIIDPLQSRCQALKIVPPTKKDVAKHVVWILEQEQIKFQMEDIVTIINQSYPDIRKILNIIQLYTHNNTLTIDKSILISNNYTTQILKLLCDKKPDWKEIRQIITNSGVQDFEELYRFLFDNADKFAPGNEGMVAIYINEYSYQSNFRIDKEINALGLIARLIELTQNKIIKG
jgi:replication factor C small subunit